MKSVFSESKEDFKYMFEQGLCDVIDKPDMHRWIWHLSTTYN